jgi:hypothetical protein
MPQFTLPPPNLVPVVPAIFASDFISVGTSLSVPPVTLPCGFTLALPKLTLGFSLKNLLKLLGLKIPSFFFAFSLSCDLSNPVNISAGLSLPFGGGRKPNAPPDPDLNDVSP